MEAQIEQLARKAMEHEDFEQATAESVEILTAQGLTLEEARLKLEKAVFSMLERDNRKLGEGIDEEVRHRKALEEVNSQIGIEIAGLWATSRKREEEIEALIAKSKALQREVALLEKIKELMESKSALIESEWKREKLEMRVAQLELQLVTTDDKSRED